MTVVKAKDGLGLPLLDRESAAEAGPGQTDKLVRQVRSGALWTGASTMILRISNIVLMAVVARIVSPDELGIFALAITVHAVLVSVAELGVASAIARTDIDIDKIAPTVVTISVATSMFLGCMMALGAGPLAAFLGSPQAEEPLRILAISVALIGPFAVPGAQLQRAFRQDLLFRANIISFAPAGIALVFIALSGDGAAAFAWSRVVGQVVAGGIMLICVGKTYLPGFNKTYLRPLMQFGIPLALANILSQVLLNLDYVFVGRMMTPADVGIYMMAFNVCMWSTAVIGAMLNGIVLPAFSSVSRDGGSVNEALNQAVRTVALVAMPIAVFTAVFSTPLVTTIYGDQWSAAGPVLAILSLYGVVSVTGLLFANIIISTGQTKVLFLVQVAALAVLVPALYVGIHLGGLVGIGIAHIIVVSVVTLPVYLAALRKATGAKLSHVTSAVARPILFALLAGFAAWLTTIPFEMDLPKLIIGGLTGAVVYLAGTFRLWAGTFARGSKRESPSAAPIRKGVNEHG